MTQTQSARRMAAVAAAALAGCSDGVTVVRSPLASNYTGAFYVQTSAQNGTNLVLVRNSPVPPEAVVEALQARYQGNQYRFALGPNPPDWNGYTVLLSFGGPAIGSQSLCENMNAPQVQPSPDRTEVVGDYCYGNRLVTEAIGRAPRITGPQDPHFRDLMGAVVAELFTNEQQRYPGRGGAPGGIPGR
jgi:hypothetical protein